MKTGTFYNDLLMESPGLIEKKLSVIREITSAIATMDNINTVANLMLDLAISYTDAEKGSLMLINEQGELSILAARGIDLHLIRTYRVRLGEGIAGTVANQRIPVLVSDIDQDERFRSQKRDRYKTRSFISCPIVSRDRLLGVLNINDRKNNTPFTDDEFELMKIVADQAAISIENAFLMSQLKDKAVELEDINRKLIEADITKTEFLTRASHELRTPLNSIKGAIYYLQKTDRIDRSEQMEFYDIISSETNNLIGIIERLLDFIRLEDELKSLNRTIIDIQDILGETLKTRKIKDRLSQKNLKVKAEKVAGITEIVGDRIKTGQFFINLLEGVSHYLEGGEEILINIFENDFVSVVLNISRKIPEPIFEYLSGTRKIFDVDHPEELVKLYLARKVAEMQGWRLDAKNEDSKCIISINIPRSIRQKREVAINKTMEMFVEFISDLLDVKTCSIMLGDMFTGELTIRSSMGLDDDVVKRTRLKPGDKIAGWVALEGKPLFIEDIENDPRFGRRNIPQYNTKSLLCLPLKTQDRVFGVLNLNNKKTSEPFSIHDFHIASVISERISYFIDKLSKGELSESDFKKFISSFETLLDLQRKYHKKQSLISELMMNILDGLGAPEEDRKIGQYVSVIYDLGLMLIDDSILQKEKLSESEVKSLKAHPYNTVFLLDGLEFSEQIKKAILHHHERYDGRGYPNGLKGEDIPLISRVLYVIDSYCAMISERPYRKKVASEEALREIRNASGSLYDPEIVRSLEKILFKQQEKNKAR
ncbi:MAG: GAF domain-containing protein [Nitrospirota bacterium]